MNMTAEKRATAYVRKLHVGDKFADSDGNWEVTREPVVIDGVSVAIWLLPVPRRRGRRPYSKRFLYFMDSRVKIIH